MDKSYFGIIYLKFIWLKVVKCLEDYFEKFCGCFYSYYI